MISELQIRLQDNYYYQRHSYEVVSPVGIENYSAQVLDAIHPAGRKLFGRLLVEELSEYQKDDSIFGFIIGQLYAEAPFLASSSPYVNVGILQISDLPVQAIGLSEKELNFLAMRSYYPHEFATPDMQFSNDYYDGDFTYSSDSLNYIGGLANTPMVTIAAGRSELMPDPILYQFPFRKEKAKLWISGSSKTRQKSESVYLSGTLTSSKLKVDHNKNFRTIDVSFSVKIEFRPEEAVNKALVAKSGSGVYNTGGADDEIWGGSGTLWPSKLTSRSWGIGFSSARKVYVNLFDVSDDNVVSNGMKTYTHDSVLNLDEFHCVLFSYNHINGQLTLTVDGVTQTFTHTGGINASITPITIGSTYHTNSVGRSHTFKGNLRNVGVWNRVVNSLEYPLVANKNYQSLKAIQKHGLILFSNLNNPFAIDETGYNNIFDHFYAPGDAIDLCFDRRDPITYSQTAKYNIVEIEDVTFWRGLGVKTTRCFAPTVYQSTGWKQENLIFASLNLASSIWLNITPEYKNDRVLMTLNSGAAKQYDIIPDLHLVEAGNYVLEFDIQNNIRNDVGNVKGFKIIFDGVTIAQLHKIESNYVFNNTSFTISPDGNWIHCKCNLNFSGQDPNNKFIIRMLTTDTTSVYDTFVSAESNTIALRRFHLHATNIEDDTYIETKSVPFVNGKHPSILFGNFSEGYSFIGEKLNITNKAIFCVCSNEAVIIDGPDYRLTTNEFISNRGGNPISLSFNGTSLYEKKLIRAYHVDGVLNLYRKTADSDAEVFSDIELNEAAQSGSQTYKLFAGCENFKLYDLIVLDDPSNYEIDATTKDLIRKYGLE